jgi:predicted alpha/beta-hydrolase family hydrolase
VTARGPARVPPRRTARKSARGAAASPVVAGPGAAEPGVAEPGVAEPGVAGPGPAGPGVAGPGVAESGVAESGVAESGVAESGVAGPGVAGPAVAETVTPYGPARITVRPTPAAHAALLLGHGAGGGIAAPDLLAAAGVAIDCGLHVVLVEQPYRVAGRRAPAPAAQLDTAWLAVVAAVRERFPGLPLLFGGRSSGARVACRTATEGGAVGVLCLAFPVHPPGKPEKDRLAELALPTVPILVVQGERDPFGLPDQAPGREVVLLRGDHSLKSDIPGLREAVRSWLPPRA